ncbi:uncharacterized protein ACRADG_004420 [Cochliomyia hominivorax]
MKFHQLIDMSIGFPEPGHVNFSALHCILTCIAEKLGITNETVDYVNVKDICDFNKNLKYELVKKPRMRAGSVPKDEISENNKSLLESKETPKQENGTANVMTTNETLEKQESELPTEVKEAAGENSFIEALNLLKSNESIESHKMITSPESHINNLSGRISQIELTLQKLVISENIFLGLAIMKDQLELVIEQLLLLTFITLGKKRDSQLVLILHSMFQTLREIKGENKYIERSNKFQLPLEPSLDWQYSTLHLNESISENDLLEAHRTSSPPEEVSPQDELGNHVYFSPSKFLDELMALKGEFCLLTNKFNELSSQLLQQENKRTPSLIREIQDQTRDIKLTVINLNETQNRMSVQVTGNMNNIDNIKRNIEELVKEKVNKIQLEIELTKKVDYKQLQGKVSLDQILELQCRMDKKFCNIFQQIKENDKKFSLIVEDLKANLGMAAIDRILKTFKEEIAKDINAVYELLENYMDSTNEKCAAAGARIKVLQDLSCLSCDKGCVMYRMEKSKLAKLPNAYSSNIIGSPTTYKLGSTKKFAHAANSNAW